jgi:hypothetical protein
VSWDTFLKRLRQKEMFEEIEGMSMEYYEEALKNKFFETRQTLLLRVALRKRQRRPLLKLCCSLLIWISWRCLND